MKPFGGGGEGKALRGLRGRLTKAIAQDRAKTDPGFTKEAWLNLDVNGASLLWEHQDDKPIGRITDRWVDKDGWCGINAVFNDDPASEPYRNKVLKGEVRGLSVGFLTNDYRDGSPITYTKFKEASVTKDPLEPGAWISHKHNADGANLDPTTYASRGFNYTLQDAKLISEEPLPVEPASKDAPAAPAPNTVSTPPQTAPAPAAAPISASPAAVDPVVVSPAAPAGSTAAAAPPPASAAAAPPQPPPMATPAVNTPPSSAAGSPPPASQNSPAAVADQKPAATPAKEESTNNNANHTAAAEKLALELEALKKKLATMEEGATTKKAASAATAAPPAPPAKETQAADHASEDKFTALQAELKKLSEKNALYETELTEIVKAKKAKADARAAAALESGKAKFDRLSKANEELKIFEKDSATERLLQTLSTTPATAPIADVHDKMLSTMDRLLSEKEALEKKVAELTAGGKGTSRPSAPGLTAENMQLPSSAIPPEVSGDQEELPTARTAGHKRGASEVSDELVQQLRALKKATGLNLDPEALRKLVKADKNHPTNAGNQKPLLHTHSRSSTQQQFTFSCGEYAPLPANKAAQIDNFFSGKVDSAWIAAENKRLNEYAASQHKKA